MTTPDIPSIAVFLLKISALLAVAVAVIALLRDAEPRWRVLLARATAMAFPLLLLAGLAKPFFSLPFGKLLLRSGGVSLPQKPPFASDSSLIDASLFPDLPPAVSEPLSFPVNLIEDLNYLELAGLAAGIMWLVIALVLISFEFFNFIKLKSAHGKGAKAVPARLSTLWQIACEEIGAAPHSSIDIVISNTENYSPFLLPGFRKKKLVLPRCLEEHFDRDTVLHVFRHEAAHIATGDVHWIPAMRLLRCVFWFHPLVWILTAQHLRACEEAADATAARLGGTESYRSALAALALELLPVEHGTTAAFIRLPSVVNRLRSIPSHVKLRPPTKIRGAAMLISVLAAGFVIGNTGLAENNGIEKVSPLNTIKLDLGARIDLEKKALAASELFLEGLELIKTEKLADAVELFFESLDTLPKNEESRSKRDPYLRQLNLSVTELAQQYLREGEDGKATVLGLRFSKYQREIEEQQSRSVPKPDPTEIWYRAYLLIQNAENLEEEGRHLEALNKLNEAVPLYMRLQTNHPDFQRDIIRERLRLTSEKREQLKQEMASKRPIVVTSSEMPETLADSILEIRGVTGEWDPDSSKGKRVKLIVEIESHHPEKVSPQSMSLVVTFYELLNHNKLIPSKVKPKLSFPSIPYNWKNGDTETIEIDYFLPKEIAAKEKRKYYGYVIELFHKDVLQYVVATPSKLLRIAP